MKHRIENLDKARADRQGAEGWWALLGRRSHDDEPFHLSPAHARVLLMICGQSYPGAKNYHESPAALNSALARIITRRAQELVAEAIEVLRTEELAAFAEARGELVELLGDMDPATGEAA